MPTNRRIIAKQSPPLEDHSKRKHSGRHEKKSSIPKISNKTQQCATEQASVPKRASASKNPNQESKIKKKKFRRIKVLRSWIFPTLFLVPLAVIALEYYIGKLISLDDVKVAYYEQLGIDPWDVDAQTKRLASPPSILNLTFSPLIECPVDRRRMINVHNPRSHSVESRRIPMIVHQHARSRCLTRIFNKATVQWAFRKWSYYFHDEAAVDMLLDIDFPEFPLLKSVATKCLRLHHTKIELWTFVNLWVYGGLYANLNLYPLRFNASTILSTDDGFFLTYPKTGKLSTNVMAVSPRHPLIFFAVQRMLDNILHSDRSGMIFASNITGARALSQALHDFQRGQLRSSDIRFDAVIDGIVHGPFRRSIRVAGPLNGTDELVSPIFISRVRKEREYHRMGANFTELHDIGSANCLHALHGL